MTGTDIIKAISKHVWPKGKWNIKVRVSVAILLLISSKVRFIRISIYFWRQEGFSQSYFLSSLFDDWANWIWLMKLNFHSGLLQVNEREKYRQRWSSVSDMYWKQGSEPLPLYSLEITRSCGFDFLWPSSVMDTHLQEIPIVYSSSWRMSIHH